MLARGLRTGDKRTLNSLLGSTMLLPRVGRGLGRTPCPVRGQICIYLLEAATLFELGSSVGLPLGLCLLHLIFSNTEIAGTNK